MVSGTSGFTLSRESSADTRTCDLSRSSPARDATELTRFRPGTDDRWISLTTRRVHTADDRQTATFRRWRQIWGEMIYMT
jgi:hypothetical protein